MQFPFFLKKKLHSQSNFNYPKNKENEKIEEWNTEKIRKNIGKTTKEFFCHSESSLSAKSNDRFIQIWTSVVRQKCSGS